MIKWNKYLFNEKFKYQISELKCFTMVYEGDLKLGILKKFRLQSTESFEGNLLKKEDHQIYDKELYMRNYVLTDEKFQVRKS